MPHAASMHALSQLHIFAIISLYTLRTITIIGCTSRQCCLFALSCCCFFIFLLLFFFCYFNCTCCVLTIYIAYMYIYIIILFDFGFSFFVILNLLQHESFSETVCFSILLLIIILLLYFLLCYCIIVYIFCSKANRKKTQRTNERANGRTNR